MSKKLVVWKQAAYFVFKQHKRITADIRYIIEETFPLEKEKKEEFLFLEGVCDLQFLEELIF